MSSQDLQSDESTEMHRLEVSLSTWVVNRVDYWKSIAEYSNEFLKQVSILEKAHYDATAKLADLPFPLLNIQNNNSNHIMSSLFKNLTCYYLNCANAGHSFTVFLAHQAIPQLLRLQNDLKSLYDTITVHINKYEISENLEKSLQPLINDYKLISSQYNHTINKDPWQIWFLFERTLSHLLYHKRSFRKFLLDQAIQIHLELESKAKSTILDTLYEVFLLKSKHELPQLCYLQELVALLCESLENKNEYNDSNMNRVSGLIELIESCTKKTREQEHYSPSWMNQGIVVDNNGVLNPFPDVNDPHLIKQEVADVSRSFYKLLQSQAQCRRAQFIPYIPTNLRDMLDESFLSCKDILDLYHNQWIQSTDNISHESPLKTPIILHGGLVYRQLGFFKAWKPFWFVLTNSNFVHAIYLPSALIEYLKSIHDGSSWSTFVHNKMQQISSQDADLDIRFTFDLKFSWTLHLSNISSLHIDRVDHIMSEESIFRIKFPLNNSNTEKIILWKCDKEKDMLEWISILNEHYSQSTRVSQNYNIDKDNINDEQSINNDYTDSIIEERNDVTTFEDPWK